MDGSVEEQPEVITAAERVKRVHAAIEQTLRENECRLSVVLTTDSIGPGDRVIVDSSIRVVPQ